MHKIYRRTPMPKCFFGKSHFGKGVFLYICYIFSEHLFLRTPLDGCFCIILEVLIFLKKLLVSSTLHNFHFPFSWILKQCYLRYCYRSSCPEVLCKKVVLKSFARFTGKHLCQSLFFNKVAGLSL